MKLFSLLEVEKNQPKLKELKIELYNDWKNIIKSFEPEFIMAENINENNIAIEEAVNNLSAYGLFYPNINYIDLELISIQLPKIILLDNEDQLVKFFEKFGRVVFDLVEYQNSVCEIICNGSYIFDS